LSDGRKKEIYQYIWFFHGALQLHFNIFMHLSQNMINNLIKIFWPQGNAPITRSRLSQRGELCPWSLLFFYISTEYRAGLCDNNTHTQSWYNGMHSQQYTGV